MAWHDTLLLLGMRCDAMRGRGEGRGAKRLPSFTVPSRKRGLAWLLRRQLSSCAMSTELRGVETRKWAEGVAAQTPRFMHACPHHKTRTSMQGYSGLCSRHSSVQSGPGIPGQGQRTSPGGHMLLQRHQDDQDESPRQPTHFVCPRDALSPVQTPTQPRQPRFRILLPLHSFALASLAPPTASLVRAGQSGQVRP